MKKLSLGLFLFTLVIGTGFKDKCKKEPIVTTCSHEFVEAKIDTPQVCSLCGEQNGKSLLDELIDPYFENNIEGPLYLPTSVGGYDIVWTSLDHSVMLDDGIFVYGNENRLVRMKATVDLGDSLYEKEYQALTNKPNYNTGKHTYAISHYEQRLKNGLGRDVALITDEYNECNVRYESENPNVITSRGKITQTTVDQQTIMNIYLIKDDIAVLFPRTVTVVAFNGQQRIDMLKPVISEIVEKYQNGLVDTLPVEDKDMNVVYSWKSNVPEFIVLDDMVLTPFEQTDLILECELSYVDKANKVTRSSLKFELNDFGGKLTKEQYLQTILDYYANKEHKGSKNYLRKEYNDELYLDYQVRTNSYGVLNLLESKPIDINNDYYIDPTRTDFVTRFFGAKAFGTYKPDVPQSKLDKLFYEGYTMPNEENVLWVVVHESAMTLDHQTAEFLAQMQYDYHFESNGREASWNYQVDAYSIHQSFGDDVICWHASDGTSSAGGGNTNGIGIEMCVNQSGNYEGTLANNAKLVASLLLKYNLNMDNVKRHFDMDPKNKECPSYLIRTNRWNEFYEMVRFEYILQKYFGNATISYEMSTAEYETTEEVLDNLYIKGSNGLYYNLPVLEQTDISFKVTIELDGHTYESSTIKTLLPDVLGE